LTNKIVNRGVIEWGGEYIWINGFISLKQQKAHQLG
jgi:hypothetical protein